MLYGSEQILRIFYGSIQLLLTKEADKSMTSRHPTQCTIDESVHRAHRFVVSAFVFSAGRIDHKVARVLSDAGLKPGGDEFKSGTRMAGNPIMQRVREGMLSIANSTAKVGVFVGPNERATLGKHSLQALQSILVRNAIPPSRLDVYFDGDIFSSP